ncbi:hypothetical protein [Legionella hackeliae]|uniref:Uncharacterized protein n=1 Tax=Legionella hackeliae TaxID=449 RepID=A0A0A8UPR9_LEGHA|nr:hypothetical protein [Legionella hackeliae]KTD09802.1 hypothetical protein Lhac_2170 [Legionella hackeliae]CEK10870.1 protein of unknown function [Legionella hackeliae]STX47607.1 Uncharacterised protein [Legionella hackeliae]
MPTTPTIDSAKKYIFDCHLFGNDSFYPNEPLFTLLKKYKWRDNAHAKQPSLTIEQLTEEGMSHNQARLCLFLIEHRDVFKRAYAGGGPKFWIFNPGHDKAIKDFILHYYTIAQWVFEGTSYLVDALDNVADELQKIANLHLPLDTNYFPLYLSENKIYYFHETFMQLKELVSSALHVNNVKNHFQNHEKISTIITRLENGANSYNPYWMNSSKKLNNILNCLARCIENSEDVDRLLQDANSPLSKALDMQRLPRFFCSSEKTQSREIINTLTLS